MINQRQVVSALERVFANVWLSYTLHQLCSFGLTWMLVLVFVNDLSVPAGPYAAYASVHLHPGGVFGGSVGGYVDAGVSGFSLRSHTHRSCQDVPAVPHLHHQRDSMCKLSTWGGRNMPLYGPAPLPQLQKCAMILLLRLDKKTVFSKATCFKSCKKFI